MASSLLRSKGTESLPFENEWATVHSVVLALLNQKDVSKQQWQDLFMIVHRICSWVENGACRVQKELESEISSYIRSAERRIRKHDEENALLRAYIGEWGRFYTQTRYLPMPFMMLEVTAGNQSAVGARSPAVPPRQSHFSSSSATSCSPSSAASVTTLHNNQKYSAARDAENAVKRLMLDIWNEVVFSGIKEKLERAAMKLVASERNGDAFDSQLVVGVRQSYVSLSTDIDDPLAIYRSHFEKSYLDSTEEFYKGRAAQILSDNGVLNYMQYADNKLKEEEQRAHRYLDTKSSDSLEKLIQKCVEVLVEAFQEQILAECPHLIKTNHIDKLRMMYRLINRTSDGIPVMLKCLDEHIRCEGLSDMVANVHTVTQDPEKYVEQLLLMFRRFSQLVTEAFYDDPRFLTARDKAFQEVVNDTTVFKLELSAPKHRSSAAKIVPESKCPELLANYCDLLLRKTNLSKKLTSEEIDAKLNDVLLVLKYVQNKDIFMRFHKAHLSRRLILDMSADQEKEEIMVARLRDAGMPSDYVHKLNRMLMDIEVNKDMNKSFKTAAQVGINNNRSTLTNTVNIKILNAGAWSRWADRVPVSLPRDLEDFILEVEDYYKRSHTGKKLQWLHHWSNGTILMTNSAGKYDLDVTTFQMAVLFCWNDRPRDKISYENLRLATELPDLELRRTLFSLVAYPKLKEQVICSDCASPNPREFSNCTQFWLNQQFCLIKNAKVQVRGRLNLIGKLQLSAEQSREQEHDDIVALRVLRVQEAIVKIVKMRKRVQSAQLQTELVEILKHMFLPSRKLIKEQIEWLIDNDYLKRDPDDINCFIYLA